MNSLNNEQSVTYCTRWDPEKIKANINNTTNNLVDGLQSMGATATKVLVSTGIRTAFIASSVAVESCVISENPEVLLDIDKHCIEIIEDSKISTEKCMEDINESIIDPCCQKTSDVAKSVINDCTNDCVDLANYSVSLFN